MDPSMLTSGDPAALYPARPTENPLSGQNQGRWVHCVPSLQTHWTLDKLEELGRGSRVARAVSRQNPCALVMENKREALV